ncbi:MAG: 50S ribosomal protein L30 [Coxiellaceae bacterium]|jgi:large subunit ribosomal protein L30|nr:50S ribosomal protein L30 [Coxiellaceae bacterium]
MNVQQKKLKITLIKGFNKKLRTHKACVFGLGLKRISQVVIRPNTPEINGMVRKINYLLKVEEI